jgi:hypothetical protein
MARCDALLAQEAQRETEALGPLLRRKEHVWAAINGCVPEKGKGGGEHLLALAVEGYMCLFVDPKSSSHNWTRRRRIDFPLPFHPIQSPSNPIPSFLTAPPPPRFRHMRR